MKNSDPLLLLYFIFLFLNLEVTYGTLSLRHEMRAFLWEKNMEISCKLLEHWPHWQYWRIENLQCCSLFFIWEKNFHPGFAFFIVLLLACCNCCRSALFSLFGWDPDPWIKLSTTRNLCDLSAGCGGGNESRHLEPTVLSRSRRQNENFAAQFL